MAQPITSNVVNIVSAAMAALDTVSQQSNNNLNATVIQGAKPQIAEQMKKDVANVVAFQTNTEEHWYQKRSFWSAIISGILVVAGPLLTKYGYVVDPTWQDSVSTMLTTIGGLWAGYLAVRAGTASKPLGA